MRTALATGCPLSLSIFVPTRELCAFAGCGAPGPGSLTPQYDSERAAKFGLARAAPGMLDSPDLWPSSQSSIIVGRPVDRKLFIMAIFRAVRKGASVAPAVLVE